MASTLVQNEAAAWVRDEWLPRHFGVAFTKKRHWLTSGGEYQFDAVSKDGAIVAAVSTSAAKTSGGKLGVGKLMKIRADLYFLLLASCRERVVVLTDQTMFAQCESEHRAGRVPKEIKFLQAELPAELAERLDAAREVASQEVRPGTSARR